MRVLILVHGYPPDQSGGAERRAARTAQHLSRRGFDVAVLAIESVVDTIEGDECWDTVEGDVLVRRLTLLANRTDSAFRTSYDNPQTANATRRMIRDFAPDVVHLFSGYLMTASAPRTAIELGIPVVVSLTDYWWLCHRITLVRTNQQRCSGPSAVNCARCQADGQRRYRVPFRYMPTVADAIWKAAERNPRFGSRLGLPEQIERRVSLTSVLNQCAALISPSQYLADFYLRHGVNQGLMHVRRQGVSVDRCRLRSESNTIRFGCLGQVKSHKGVDLVLDAWRHLQSNWPRHLYIYGSSEGEPEYGELVRSAVEQMDDVSWPGEYRGDEVWDVMRNLDVLVVPSRWVENSPNSVLEAQAVGLPVIAANLGALSELVVHERNGLVFNADDSTELRAQIQRLLDDPGLIGTLRSNPFPFITVDDEIDQLTDLYTKVVWDSSHHRTGQPAHSESWD